MPKPPQIVVLGPTAGMQLDCKFSQPPWNAVSPMKFVDRHGNTAQYGASVRTAWDDDHLYFACTNQEPEIESLKTLATAQDPTKKPAVWEDDTVEIFLCPDAEDRARCYQFIINAKGVILDVAYGESSNFKPDFTWSSGVEAKARIEKNRWLVEVRIPFKDLGISRPAQGRTIALNVYRNRYCDARVTHSCWSATGQRPPLTRERFGLMTLG
ncbi:MAG: carbohydrate-binding family 9-like protein [Lentisphaerae bacterium]|nr:carbohydrate-binding family 9-like protein [Lentisphaerota bacterium]